MDWYPWFPAAYAQATLALSLEQDAIYRRMIDWYMTHRLPLPSHSQAIARICQISLDKWLEHKAALEPFLILKGDRYHIKKCDIELDRQDSLSRKMSVNAKKAKAKRSTISNTSKPRLEYIDIDSRQRKKKKEKEEDPKFDPSKIAIPEWLPSSVWVDWVNHRRSIKKPITERSAQLTIGQLSGFRSDGHDPVAIINRSIMSGWQGLFEPKNQMNGHAAAQTKKTYSDNVLAAMRGAQRTFENSERKNDDEIPL